MEFTKHARDQMRGRRVTEEEVQLVVESGTPADAREPKFAREMVFSKGYYHRGRHYPRKRVKAILAYRGEEIVIVTVIAYYGTWEGK